MDEKSRCCAACGKGNDGLHLKRCRGCVVTYYCGKDCQQSHWQTHKTECKQLLDEALFQQPPQREECPICFQCLPPAGETVWNPCCSKTICSGCVYASTLSKGETPHKVGGGWRTSQFTVCAFCRTPWVSSNEEYFERLNKRMTAGDAAAYHNLACKYLDGYMGLKRDPEKAEKLFLQAAKMGSMQAHCSLGVVYDCGRGVEKNLDKAIYHYQISAMGGEEIARHNLGNIELAKGNVTKAKKHWMIGARAGFDASLKHIRLGYEKGWASKDEYAEALRAHKDAKDEMKDSHRENARQTGSTWKEDIPARNDMNRMKF